MSNAVLDPLGRKRMSPSELATAFNIIRANVLFDAFSSFPSFEEISGARNRFFFHQDDLPEAVMFVSHRWQSPSHPDPDAEQLSAVKTFLASLRRISSRDG